MTENTVAIASRLYECRRLLRRLLGTAYAGQALKWMEVVEHVGRVKSLDVIHACTLLLEREPDGMAQMWVCCAAVELLEPDELTPVLERVA